MASSSSAPLGGQTEAEGIKKQHDEVIRVVSSVFLAMRKDVTSIMDPRLGSIDDMTITWQCQYLSDEEALEWAKSNSGPKPLKVGKLHMSYYTKTPPDSKQTQVFNSFNIDANITFVRDDHPSVEKAAASAAAAAPAPS